MTERDRIIATCSDAELLMLAMLGCKARGPAGMRQVVMLNKLQRERIGMKPAGRPKQEKVAA